MADMTDTPQMTTTNGLMAAASRFTAFIADVATQSYRGRAIERLSRMTDAQLESLGTNRRVEAQRILGGAFYL